jgi:hypothetical protein
MLLVQPVASHYSERATLMLLLAEVFLEELAKKYPVFYGAQIFITVFTKSRHLPLF